MVKLKYIKYIAIAIVCFIVFIFITRKEQETPVQIRDYNEISKDGVLHVTTEYNSIGFFSDSDSVSGFQYDLINEFAKEHNLKVEITPVMSYEERLLGLKSGKFDVIASSVPVTNTLDSAFQYTDPLIRSKLVLIQRKPSQENDSMFIKTHLDLANCTLYVVKESPAIVRINNLSSEIGDTIYIQEIEKYGQEQLLSLVAHGDIDYAVCNEDVAKALINDFPQLDIDTDISFTQFYSWIVNSQSTELLDSINDWLDTTKKSKSYQNLYNKYFPR